MLHRRIYHLLIAMFAILFISLQSFALGHDSAYGEAPHEHEGIACDVSVLISEDIAIIPVIPTFVAPVIEFPKLKTTPYASVRYMRPASRAPPPRSPPLA